MQDFGIGVLKQFGTGCWVCTCFFSSKSAHPNRQGPIQLAWKNASGLEQIFEENWSKNIDFNVKTIYGQWSYTSRLFKIYLFFNIFYCFLFVSHLQSVSLSFIYLLSVFSSIPSFDTKIFLSQHFLIQIYLISHILKDVRISNQRQLILQRNGIFQTKIFRRPRAHAFRHVKLAVS